MTLKNNVQSILVKNAKGRIQSTLESKNLISAWKHVYDIDISKELEDINTLYLYRCEASGLDFFLPLSATGSEDIYRELQKFNWYYLPDKWEYRAAVKDLDGCERILEVGSGAGFFLKFVSRRKPDIIIKGIEYSRDATLRARREGLAVEQTSMRVLLERGERYDAICSFQVLEHTVNPGIFLDDAAGLLRSGGKMILSVPNRDSFLKYQYNLLDMPPHHMSRWNLDVLQSIQNYFPFTLSHFKFEPLADVHVEGFVHAYLRYAGLRWSSISPIFSNILKKFALATLRTTGLYKLFRGQGIYAVFIKR